MCNKLQRRQDDWGQKLGSGKHDLAGTLMMFNPYTGSLGRFWWRVQAWFTTIGGLGECRWAVPEAERLVCECVLYLWCVCVRRTDPATWTGLWMEVYRVGKHTQISTHSCKSPQSKKKSSAFPQPQSSGTGTLDLVIISRAVSFDLLLMSVLGSSHL